MKLMGNLVLMNIILTVYSNNNNYMKMPTDVEIDALIEAEFIWWFKKAVRV